MTNEIGYLFSSPQFLLQLLEFLNDLVLVSMLPIDNDRLPANYNIPDSSP
jgi:hypothetical protein